MSKKNTSTPRRRKRTVRGRAAPTRRRQPTTSVHAAVAGPPPPGVDRKTWAVFQQLCNAHRNIHDIFWNLVLNDVDELFDELMLNYPVRESIPTAAIPKSLVDRFGYPDNVAFCSYDPQDTWLAARKRKRSGADPLILANTEAKKVLHAAAAAEQLFEYKYGLRTRFGPPTEIQQRVFVTGDQRPHLTELLVEGASTRLPAYYVPVIYRGDLHADRVPAGFYEHPVGAIATLLLPHGDTLAHVVHAFRLVWGTPHADHAPKYTWLLALAAQLLPELFILYEEANRMMEEEAMANGMTNVAEENWQQMRKLVQVATDVFKEEDLEALPRFRERFEQGIEQGIEQGRNRERIDILLQLLQQRSIRLSPRHENRLRKLTNGELPDIALALNATSGADFARRAGLTGRRNGNARRSRRRR